MNNMPFPYMPFPTPYPNNNVNNQNNFQEEIEKLKTQIRNLERRVSSLENNNKNDYTKKETGMYMM